MGTLDTYTVDLLSPELEGKTFEYSIGDDFFAAIDGLIQRGSLACKVECISAGTIVKFRIHSSGTVTVPCDRCLADLDVRIETSDVLKVKLGEEYSDDGECVVVPEAEGRIDLAQFIYEFIALSMPMTCCHEPGECDSAMMLELSKHQSTRSGAEDEEEMDSDREYGEANGESMGDEDVEPVDERWAALKILKDKQ